MLERKIICCFIWCALDGMSLGAQTKVIVNWDKADVISQTTPTLQVVVNPPLRKGYFLHDSAFGALKALGANFVRFVPWMPYPRLSVAELEPPTAKTVFWDFQLIDPLVSDFLQATQGHSVVLNFSTIPQWMFKTPSSVSYPLDPDTVSWDYSQGNTLRDTTLHELSGYYSRLFSWYEKGGFIDELGKLHLSGHHYDIPYWEILNEPELEHSPTPAEYTREYDAIVKAIRKISPATKFVGMALAFEQDPEWFEYFLNPKNHSPGIPIDMISYHFYATSGTGQTIDDMQYTYFERANGFLNTVRYIENLRKRFSPKTRTTIDEVGSILHNEEDSIPPAYWNLSGALYAYLYLHLARIHIDFVGESQLVGYPTQYPSVSMMNWKTGSPNARYWALKLLVDNFGPGDTLVHSSIEGTDRISLTAQGFITHAGRRLLLINTRNKMLSVTLPDACIGGQMSVVDVFTGDRPPSSYTLKTADIELKPFAVAVASF